MGIRYAQIRRLDSVVGAVVADLVWGDVQGLVVSRNEYLVPFAIVYV